jgi:hypothetical protein
MADLESPGLGITVREMLLRHTPRIDGDPFNEVFLQKAEFLKHKKIGAHGTDIAISPSDILDMTQLSARTDRVLPNWPVIVIVYCAVALVPPLLVLALSTRRSARTRRIQRRLVRVLTRYGPISVRILFLVAGVALATDALIHHSALW